MSTSVQAAREALGNRLRDIRKDARLTGRQLADLCGWHFTKVSKLEHGTTAPSEGDLELWCLHCRAQAQLPDLVATARGIEKMYVELKRLMRAGTARYQREFLENEAVARRHRVFTMFMVPGVLQTKAYATVRLTEFSEMTQTPANVEQTVEVRMQRGQLIRSGDRMFHFVVCEAALRTAMAPPEVMREQLEYLLEASRLTRVHLGIVPAKARQYMPLCEFWIMDDDLAETETYSAAIRMSQPSEIAVYARVFDHYSRVAVYGDDARALIRSALSEFEQQ
ncbi:MAG TPA: helix-turn-helix transcriptional regulator [Actinocrinis sp.]|jgi:transcriptional regulator with XRE-family HTH domain|uniref:helix-turn-helix domain-containing protein n=1 Tax=Actinocrinis sp. TaxID=1920516 RepID=UPI002DDD207F|nr:helix-turn-helix transcriptional regulator [Actinocrinis sp.]HEV3170820.1 helix-turn-helix transcriptional regulator [Actinocrinis sp.]